MKKFVVIKIYKAIEPNVVFWTDDEQDARDYARIMHHKDGGVYAAVEVSNITIVGDENND